VKYLNILAWNLAVNAVSIRLFITLEKECQALDQQESHRRRPVFGMLRGIEDGTIKTILSKQTC
jgi:hypothetical protein